MRFSLDWLSQYVDLGLSATRVGELLTSLGFAVEGLEAVDDDVVLDLEINPNRVDCMNHLGLARELAAIREQPLRPPAIRSAPAVVSAESADVAVEIEDPADCPRYVAVLVRGIEVGPSPQWLVRRLQAVGVRPINNVVDITNFVLWELGQPLHAFDLDRLRGSQLAIRRAVEGEHLVTLDGIGRELGPEILVIADREEPVALAGVMGGAATEVGGATRDVLIESAHFAPTAVRRAAGRLGLHTDASHRFERGSDPGMCLRAALRAADLMTELAGGEVEGEAVDCRPAGPSAMTGALDLGALERFAGAPIDRALVERVFPALGFELESTGPETWRVVVPSWRQFDIETDAGGEARPAHFYEEALRFHGYDAVPATLPEVGGPDSGSSEAHERRERLRALLAASGLAETITYGFYDRKADRRFACLERAAEPLVLSNALSEQYALMRRSLMPNLVDGALFNLNRGREVVRLFEIGHVFPGGSEEELELVGLIVGGALGMPWTRRHELDVFDLKGIVEEMAARFGLRLEFVPGDVTGFVAGTASEIRIADERQTLGYLGEIDERRTGTSLYGAELRTVAFGERQGPTVEVPSRFPGIALDLTLTHSFEVSWAMIAAAVEEHRPADLVSFELKDRYHGEGMPAGTFNTTLAFFYNSPRRSLRRDEVHERHERLTAALRRRFSEEG